MTFSLVWLPIILQTIAGRIPQGKFTKSRNAWDKRQIRQLIINEIKKLLSFKPLLEFVSRQHNP